MFFLFLFFEILITAGALLIPFQTLSPVEILAHGYMTVKSSFHVVTWKRLTECYPLHCLLRILADIVWGGVGCFCLLVYFLLKIIILVLSNCYLQIAGRQDVPPLFWVSVRFSFPFWQSPLQLPLPSESERLLRQLMICLKGQQHNTR